MLYVVAKLLLPFLGWLGYSGWILGYWPGGYYAVIRWLLGCSCGFYGVARWMLGCYGRFLGCC